MMKGRFLAVFISALLIGGISSSMSAMAAQPIVIGVCTSLGFLAGYESRDIVLMAVEEINAKGGVNVGGVKRPFKAVIADSRDAEPGVPISEGLMAYEKLILQEKPHAIIPGFFTSEITLASMDITSKYKLPLLATSQMSPKYEQKILENYDAYKYHFRLCHNSIQFTNAFLGKFDFIKKKFNFNKIFILKEEAIFAKAIADITEETLKKRGWEVVENQSFPKGASDYSASLQKVKNTKAQVIAFICSTTEAVVFADQWRAMRVPALLTGLIPALASENDWGVHKGKIEGIISLNVPGCVPIKAIPESVSFYDKIKKKLGKGPGGTHTTGPTYDAVYVLKEAIERAGTLDGDRIVSEIEKTDRKGVIGRIRFDKGHQVIYGTNPQEAALAVDQQWQKPGIRVIVYPETVATGEIQLPPWMK